MYHVVTVIGDPIPCDTSGCGQPALVYLRSQSEGGISGIAYCGHHWAQTRRIPGPVIADDAAEAQAGAERVVREGAQ